MWPLPPQMAQNLFAPTPPFLKRIGEDGKAGGVQSSFREFALVVGGLGEADDQRGAETAIGEHAMEWVAGYATKQQDLPLLEVDDGRTAGIVAPDGPIGVRPGASSRRPCCQCGCVRGVQRDRFKGGAGSVSCGPGEFGFLDWQVCRLP